MIHAASHVDHEKRVAWIPISMLTCGPFPIIMDAPLGGPSGRRSSANKKHYCMASSASEQDDPNRAM